MAYSVVYKDVDVWKREIIFCASFIEVSIINAHSHLTIYLHDWNYVSNPLWIDQNSDELCLV